MNVTEIQDRLNIESHGLSRAEREGVLRIAQQLVERLTCEQWGHERGWQIAEYGTPEWRELYAAWLDSEDDDEPLRRPR
jgi:hypothetical protein